MQGTQFLSVVVFTPITAFVLVTTFLPIFHNLQVNDDDAVMIMMTALNVIWNISYILLILFTNLISLMMTFSFRHRSTISSCDSPDKFGLLLQLFPLHRLKRYFLVALVANIFLLHM